MAYLSVCLEKQLTLTTFVIMNTKHVDYSQLELTERNPRYSESGGMIETQPFFGGYPNQKQL